MQRLLPMVLVACYAPQPKTGTPCTDDAHCPTPLVCSPATMTCERDRSNVDAAAVDTPDATAACDPCEPNDLPMGSLDVTAGGTFTANLLAATDDVLPFGCGGDGGRDVFYRISLAAPQVYYFDTFGSTFDTVVRVFAKPCSQVGNGANAARCEDNACGGAQSQLALSLPAGESCIVVDQASGAEAGALTLHVIRGTRDGMLLPTGAQTLTGDTCTSTNITEPLNLNCDGPGALGKDVAYYFTTCPTQSLLLDADLCPAPSWDAVLYVKRIDGTQLGCNDDTCGNGPQIANVPISGSSLYFLYVDGFDATFCGAYSLDTNLR